LANWWNQPGKAGDFVRIDLQSGRPLTFVKEAENAMVPMLLERYGAAAGVSAVAARD